MAKPLSNISKTEFRDSYNIFEVLTSKTEIMEFVKNLKDDNNYAVAFARKKQHKLTLEDRMIGLEEKLVLIMNEIKSIKTEMKDSIQSINNRLDNIVAKNNLIE